MSFVKSFFSAVKRHPKSPLLWQLYLKYKINKPCSEEEIQRIFQKGKTALNEMALPLYQELIKYYLITGATEKLESLYRSTFNLHENISHALVPEYLKWMVVISGRDIEEARTIYNTLSAKKPFCKKLHDIMASLECAEEDMENWEKVLNRATEQFPEDLDVWCNYMNFFIQFKKKSTSEDRKKIYYKAISMLPDIKKRQFESEYGHFFLKS